MGAIWKAFEMPKRVECDGESYSSTYGKFIAEPFERGYGTTIGNGFRRILISSIEGAAVISIKLDGALHEFTGVSGVVEDVTQVVLNVKQLILRLHGSSSRTIRIRTEKKGAITAKDIEHDEAVEILNPDLHLATLTKPAPFHLEMEVGRGRGYAPAEKNKREDQPIGVIPVDASFTPVKRVNFAVEETRVGQMTDYDRLILEIWTNGSVTPKDALLYAANIYQRHLDVFVSFGRLPEEEEPVEPAPAEELLQKLRQPVSELELSVRSANCLREAKIKTIADLVQKTELEMLKYRNFGRKSLSEIKLILDGMGLDFSMPLDENILKRL